jgi:hypothetical protein
MTSLDRAQSAGAVLGRTAEDEPIVHVRFLNTMDAFNSVKPGQPSYSMRKKLGGEMTRGKVHTELGPDVSGRMDVALKSQPKWTVKGRWKAEEATNAWVPAPGAYKNPSTLEKTHPTMKCSGRGWTWGGQDRPSLATTKEGPGPSAYRDDRKDCAMTKEPSWTLIGRPNDPGSKPANPLVPEPNLIRDTSGMSAKGGVVKTPEWQFQNRPASVLVPAKSAAKQPGPDRYSPQAGGIGAPTAPLARIKRSPSYGFGSCPRFKKPTNTVHVL